MKSKHVVVSSIVLEEWLTDTLINSSSSNAYLPTCCIHITLLCPSTNSWNHFPIHFSISSYSVRDQILQSTDNYTIGRKFINFITYQSFLSDTLSTCFLLISDICNCCQSCSIILLFRHIVYSISSSIPLTSSRHLLRQYYHFRLYCLIESFCPDVSHVARIPEPSDDVSVSLKILLSRWDHSLPCLVRIRSGQLL